MAAVMIRCPESGRVISTGYDVDPERFRKTPVFFARSLCPFCRTEHEWFAKNAWVEGEAAPLKRIPCGTVNLRRARQKESFDELR
jgi:hypothetical protein